jgi:hypothetical protein
LPRKRTFSKGSQKFTFFLKLEIATLQPVNQITNTKSSTMSKRTALTILAAILYSSDSSAFVNRPSNAFVGSKQSDLAQTCKRLSSKTRQQCKVSMYLDGAHHDLAVLAAPMLTSTIAIPSSPSFLNTLFDPAIESELFTDAAHVGLDLTTMVRPATAFLRVSVLFGRICAILSDYIPDRYMHPEEIAFQSVMLLVAAGACLQSFLPLLFASTAKISYRDARAYALLFSSLGISWTQYKAMVAVALDWKQVDPNEFVQDSDKDDYMYWLYSGDALVRSGKQIQNVTTSSGYNGLFGELKFAQLLDKTAEATTIQHPSPEIQAGETGATLIRLHMKKLKMLMDQDPDLAEAIQSLLVKGMHEKLSALMKQE